MGAASQVLSHAVPMAAASSCSELLARQTVVIYAGPEVGCVSLGTSAQGQSPTACVCCGRGRRHHTWMTSSRSW